LSKTNKLFRLVEAQGKRGAKKNEPWGGGEWEERKTCCRQQEILSTVRIEKGRGVRCNWVYGRFPKKNKNAGQIRTLLTGEAALVGTMPNIKI